MSIYYVAIKQYFLGNFQRPNFLWISKPFLVEKNSIYDNDMTAKIEFFQLREDANLKTDLTREDIGKFWVGIQNEYPVLSIKALSFIQFPLTYCYEVGFSSVVS